MQSRSNLWLIQLLKLLVTDIEAASQVTFLGVHFYVCEHVFERLNSREPSSKPTYLGPSLHNKLQLPVAVAALSGKKLARAKETGRDW